MSDHALFSPSGAHRWIVCPGSLALEAGYPRTSSVYADEGTAAHTLAAWCLEEKRDADGYIGRTILVGDRSFEVDDDMAAAVQVYVDAVRSAADGRPLFVEQRVEFGGWIGQPAADAFGTSDAIIVNGGTLEVHDLKYGKGVRVDATANEQMMLYALGALDAYDFMGPFERFRMVIHQPRISETPSAWECSFDELVEFAKRVEVAAYRAGEAITNCHAGATPQETADAGFINPDEHACRFCKAKADCPAVSSLVARTISDEPLGFDDLDAPRIEQATGTVPLLYNEALGHRLALVGIIEDWCAAVRSRAHDLLEEGKPVAGFKMVQGKPGNRAWSNPAEAEATLKSFRLKVEDMFDLKLISPTSAEKLAKAGAIGPRQWPKVEALIVRPAGKPSVVPDSDPRPSLAPVAFTNLDETGCDLA